MLLDLHKFEKMKYKIYRYIYSVGMVKIYSMVWRVFGGLLGSRNVGLSDPKYIILWTEDLEICTLYSRVDCVELDACTCVQKLMPRLHPLGYNQSGSL